MDERGERELGTGTGAEGSAAPATYGERGAALASCAGVRRGDGAAWNGGNGKPAPSDGVGGSDGEDSDEDGAEPPGELGEARPCAGGGAKAVEIARGIECP